MNAAEMLRRRLIELAAAFALLTRLPVHRLSVAAPNGAGGSGMGLSDCGRRGRRHRRRRLLDRPFSVLPARARRALRARCP